jgi:alkanesulfonate monooxygenase SsuD/methylene tetrahydromethanopterin reductase-like flavin-dependent oxidoreductase (luciferase family)
MSTPILFALTDHLESPRERPSAEVFEEVASYVRLADQLRFDYYFFTEHHAHAHYGHMPTPLLFALHLAGQTEQIHLGTAIICLNLHNPLSVAEHVAVADHLMKGRFAPGFGSGSTPEEFALFGQEITKETVRHERFQEALRLITDAWRGEVRETGPHFPTPAHAPLPVAAPDLRSRSWLAVNSAGSARIAGAMGFNMLYSHLRTPAQYREYRQAYIDAGGQGLIAANRPVYVGADDTSAQRDAEEPIRTLWRRFRSEGKIPASTPEPQDIQEVCGHPLNFLLGGPDTVARQIAELRAEAYFDVINLEPNWAGLEPKQIQSSISLLATEVRPRLNRIEDWSP